MRRTGRARFPCRRDRFARPAHDRQTLHDGMIDVKQPSTGSG
jgi:hypothetical protein